MFYKNIYIFIDFRRSILIKTTRSILWYRYTWRTHGICLVCRSTPVDRDLSLIIFNYIYLIFFMYGNHMFFSKRFLDLWGLFTQIALFFFFAYFQYFQWSIYFMTHPQGREEKIGTRE